jgi:hypothetical protein
LNLTGARQPSTGPRQGGPRPEKTAGPNCAGTAGLPGARTRVRAPEKPDPYTPLAWSGPRS